MAASKLKTVRVPDDGRWERATAKAEAAGTSVSAILNAALDAYAPAPAQAQAQASGTMDGATRAPEGAPAA